MRGIAHVFTPQLQSPALGACSEREMEMNLVNAQISRLLEVKPALILHVHPLSLLLYLSLSPPPFSLHLSHLFICCSLTVFIIALALAQHVLPKQDAEMEFEKKSVWEIVNEAREEVADREKQRAIK